MSTSTDHHEPPPLPGSGAASARSGLRLPLSRVWCIAAVLAPVLAITIARLGTVDLTYHLRAGGMMLDSRSIIRTDSFTFTAAGLPWLDQQWGSQVILAALFRVGGWMALAATRSLLAGIALVCVYLACRARGATIRVASWLTFGSAFLMLAGVQLRPQLFGVACFAMMLWLLAGRRAHPKRMWLAVPITILWANVHGTYFLALALIGLAWLEDVGARDRGAVRLIGLGLACALATMVNPFGLQIWSYVLGLTSNEAVRGAITEWQPTSIDSYTGAAFLASVPVVAMLFARSRTRPRYPLMVALAVFLALGLMSVRGVFWWAMAAPVLLAGTIGGDTAESSSDPVNAVNSIIAGMLVVGVLAVFTRWVPFASPVPVPEHLLTEAPVGITEQLRTRLRSGERFFNAQGWGSWFEHALPGHPVAVDSRIEVIPADVWQRYDDVSNGRQGWQRILDEWNVRVVALHPGQQANLISRIAQDPGWLLAYHDTAGSVFVRR